MKPEGGGTFLRASALLNLFAEVTEPMTLSEVCERLSWAPSTTHRLLNELTELGWLERGRNRRYRIGLELYRLGTVFSERLPIVPIARPYMHKVVEACDETCLLSILLPDSLETMFVSKVDATHPLRYRFQMHERRSLMWGAPGRMLLALSSESDIDAVRTRATVSRLGIAVPERGALLTELEQCRRGGHAFTNGHYLDWAVGIAVPVYGAANRLLASLAVVIPEVRYKRARRAQLVGLLQRQAGQLSRALGMHTGTGPASDVINEEEA